MIHRKKMRFVPLLLGALALISACASAGRPSDPSEETQTPPAVGATESGEPDQSAPPQDSGTPAPGETAPVQPSSEPPAPEQSESPTPAQSELPAPVQSESPAPSQNVQPSPYQGETPVVTAPAAAGQGTDDNWFSDAVFLGDSRTDGLRLYSGIRGASFIAHQGLSVFTVDSNQCINVDGVKLTAMEALSKQQWGKVYLMLGINELGYTTAAFKNAYSGIVDQIRTIQPGAVIYLQTLIPINEPIAYENGTNAAINNEKLKEFNQAISEIAQEKGAFLVDVDSYFWSPEGCLAPENTGDGVHLTRAGYVAWFEYLKTHTGAVTPVEFWPSENPAPIESWTIDNITLPDGSYAAAVFE